MSLHGRCFPSVADHAPPPFADADESTPSKIAEAYPELTQAMDCVSEKGSTLLIAKSFASKKGKIVTILPVKDETLDKEFSGVEHDFTLVYTLLGDSFDFGPIPFAANPDDKKALEEWWVPMPRSFSLDLQRGR